MAVAKGYRQAGKWITAPCTACGREMTFRLAKPKRYCGRACAAKSNAHWPADPEKKTETPCAICGRPFVHYVSDTRRFCSRVCAGAANIGNTGKPVGVRYTTVCAACGVSFETVPSQPKRFCSQTCFGRWNSEHVRGEAHPNTGRRFGRAKHWPPPLIKTCAVCEATFTVKPSHADRRRFCSHACQGAWLSANNAGPNNANWLGGYEPYYGPSWRPAMRAARRRDKICQRCGMPPAPGRALDVHHVVPFRLFGLARHAEANATSNLVTLCAECHTTVEWETNRRESHG